MKVITIDRECSAGGRSVGLLVGKELGLEMYDRDIIRKLAAEMDEDYEDLRYETESLSSVDTFIHSITPISYSQKDALQATQRRIITDFAKEGPCIIVGRAAGAILEDEGIEHLRVFLYANELFRGKRLGELLGTTDMNVIHKNMVNLDKRRKTFYEHYTDRKWGDYHNYDLMLDTGVLGYEGAAKMICEAARLSE